MAVGEKFEANGPANKFSRVEDQDAPSKAFILAFTLPSDLWRAIVRSSRA